MNTNYKMNELPLADLEKLGLYKDGKLLIPQEDRDALLAGRRTELISMHDLKADGFNLDQLDAKLSIVPDWDNKLTLKIHPIYKEPRLHPLLDDSEAQMLINGKLDMLRKTFQDGDKKTILNFEYDPETKEFVSYDPKKVIAPEMVNNEKLTEKQKAAFRNGEVVGLSDGTKFQHRAGDKKAIRSDRIALIVSILLDGGISYLLLRGVKNLAKAEEAQKDEFYTAGYEQALKDMQVQQKKPQVPFAGQQEFSNEHIRFSTSQGRKTGR